MYNVYTVYNHFIAVMFYVYTYMWGLRNMNIMLILKNVHEGKSKNLAQFFKLY